MLTLDPKVDTSEAKTIRLAGDDYFIPQLMLRQTVKIGPLIPQILKIINRRSKAFETLASGEVAADNADLMEAVSLSEDEIGVSVRVLAAGLSRAYPGVTLDELYDMPIEIGEIIVALTTVILQTRAVRTDGAAKPLGEAEATNP